MGSDLGVRLREVREMRRMSLKSAAEPAGISPAYLQKLERGDVKAPSPHVLHRLSGALEIPYATLMELAGYIVPTGDQPQGSLLAYALSSEELTEDEAESLARYLAWYRHDKGSRSH